MANAFENAPRAPRGQNQGGNKLKLLKSFKDLGSLILNGEQTPVEAHDWLKVVVRDLNVIGVPGQFRVEFAAYLFRGYVLEWWKSKRVVKMFQGLLGLSSRSYSGQHLFLRRLDRIR